MCTEDPIPLVNFDCCFLLLGAGVKNLLNEMQSHIVQATDCLFIKQNA